MPPAQVKVIVTSDLFHPAALGKGAGLAEIVRVGGAKVTLTLENAVLPARSVAWTAIVLAPAASGTLQDRADGVTEAGRPLQVALAMPERPSVAEPVTAAGEVVRVAAWIGVVIATTGGVLSIFRVTEAVALLPKLSVAVRETVWLAPSVDTSTG